MGTIQNVRFHSPLSHFSFMLHTIVTDWPQLQDSNWNAMVYSICGWNTRGGSARKHEDGKVVTSRFPVR